MLLYVQVYGLSVKRVLTLWLMAVVGVSLVWLLLQCINERLNALRMIGGTIIVFVCVLSLVNVDKTSARYNIERYLHSPEPMELDVSYLNELSYSALPEVVTLYESLGSGAEDPLLRESVGYVLEGMRGEYRARHSVYGFTAESPKLSQYLG
jgi:hypothetical protein